jgi:dipeptidyl aminopeptidase/acylaminoacyl peptidase
MADTTPLIPRETLFGNPTRAEPIISPDGRYIAYLAPVNGVLNVWVRTVGADDDRPVTNDTYRGIRWHFWAGDSAHVAYLQDLGGDENWRLNVTSLATSETRDLTPFKDVQARPVHRDKRFPDEMVIALNKDDPAAHDAYRINLRTGEMSLAAKNPGPVLSWVSDARLNVRGAVASDAEGGSTFVVRDDDAAEWRAVATWSADDALTSGPIGFSRDGSTAFLRDSRGVNATRLVKLDVASGRTQSLIAHDTYDVGEVALHPDTYEPQLASITQARKEWVVLDESLRGDIAAIRALHSGDWWITSRDDADRMWIVGFVADDGPVAYHAFDRTARSATFLFVHRPDLSQFTLSPMQPISFVARDGLTIHGYLTLPPDRDMTSSDLPPLVLNVHGGPWWRNEWGLDPEAQWFANRGYACLQVNFRGSTGYGKAFVNAGDREWAARMHDDLVDAVEWAVGRGLADPKRVAIYGGSYGGYAALVGATFTPELFCCAVDVVGPSNLVTLLKSIPPYWAPMRTMMYRRIGNPDTEPEFLESRSPLFKAARIKIPMLIAQGANDPRVKQAESEQIVEAMKRNGVDYEYMLFEDEGHGFARPENRLKFYAAAERFLARHLGGRFEA